MEPTIYSIPTDPTYYGDVLSNVDGQVVAQTIADHVAHYAQEQGWNIETRLVPETISHNNQSTGDEDIIAELDYWVERNWTDWEYTI